MEEGFDGGESGGGLSLLLGMASGGGVASFADISANGEGFIVIGARFVEGAVGGGLSETVLSEFLEA